MGRKDKVEKLSRKVYDQIKAGSFYLIPLEMIFEPLMLIFRIQSLINPF